MIDIYFDKLYRYDRIAEPCYIGIPVREGDLWDTEGVRIYQNGKRQPIQTKVTSRHKDGSVRFLFLRFLADLPGNKGVVLQCDLHGGAGAERNSESGPERHCAGRPEQSGVIRPEENAGEIWPDGVSPLSVNVDGAGITVSTVCGGENHALSFRVEHNSEHIFERLFAAGRVYDREQFAGPFLKDGEGRKYRMQIGSWRVVEQGPVCAVLKASGSNVSRVLETTPRELKTTPGIDFEIKLTAWAGKPWVEVSYRLINTTDKPLHVASLVFQMLRTADAVPSEGLVS
ncbi:MAG: hypothetical protein K2H40_05560, partial [Lachnospiraceae bacterium]|nr:hypothetical protein [Lachnospiraceae bacterium]